MRAALAVPPACSGIDVRSRLVTRGHSGAGRVRPIAACQFPRLQMDFNLLGMGLMKLSRVLFRGDLPARAHPLRPGWDAAEEAGAQAMGGHGTAAGAGAGEGAQWGDQAGPRSGNTTGGVGSAATAGAGSGARGHGRRVTVRYEPSLEHVPDAPVGLTPVAVAPMAAPSAMGGGPLPVSPRLGQASGGGGGAQQQATPCPAQQQQATPATSSGPGTASLQQLQQQLAHTPPDSEALEAAAAAAAAAAAGRASQAPGSATPADASGGSLDSNIRHERLRALEGMLWTRHTAPAAWTWAGAQLPAVTRLVSSLGF